MLLIDAVTWSSAYPDTDPWRNVRGWYARWFADSPELALERADLDEDLDTAIQSGVDGVILSGSPRDAWRDDPVNDRLLRAIRTCREKELPFLGVCFGHQLLARALGGTVAPHPGGLELGNTPVRLTEEGKSNRLFHGFPDCFEVLSSHGDAVVSMPPECELLVRGAFTENQGFHWHDRMYGVQFHPETDPEVLRFLWQPRIEKWQPKVGFDLETTLAAMRPVPQAAEVLRNFVFRCIPDSNQTL